MVEKRESTRKVLSPKIEIKNPEAENWEEGWICDLTVVGALLEPKEKPQTPLKSGDEVQIQFVHFNKDVIKSSVKWYADKGDRVLFGVKFDQESISDQLFEEIKRIVAQN